MKANEAAIADHLLTIPKTVEPRHDVIAWGVKDRGTGMLPVYRADGSLWFVFDAVEKPTGCRVYFIGTGNGPVKIGISNDPPARLRGLQVASPYPLKILATTRGGLKKEAEYHARFAEHRLSGEWFSPHPAILQTIKRLSRNSPPLAEIARLNQQEVVLPSRQNGEVLE